MSPEFVVSALKGIYKISDSIKKHKQSFVLLKCVEEMGEVAKAINQPHRVDEPAETEIADLIISAIDLHYVRQKKADPDISHTNALSLLMQDVCTKLEKWEAKVSKNNIEEQDITE